MLHILVCIIDYVYSLLNVAQRGLHEMFLRTYGVMYQNNANVFQDYFKVIFSFFCSNNVKVVNKLNFNV